MPQGFLLFAHGPTATPTASVAKPNSKSNCIESVQLLLEFNSAAAFPAACANPCATLPSQRILFGASSPKRGQRTRKLRFLQPRASLRTIVYTRSRSRFVSSLSELNGLIFNLVAACR